MKTKSQDKLKSVEKALQILGVFSIEKPELSISDLVEIMHIPKVSLYRFLRVMMRNGFITQNEQTRRYQLGIRVFELGSIVLRNFELRKIAFPMIVELSRLSGETVHLGVVNDQMVLSIEGVESDQSLRFSLPIGKRVYIHSTGIGKALLAFLPDAEVEQIIRTTGLPGFTQNTISDREKLDQEIALIRRRGFAVDNEENETGIRCVAAPIFNPNGEVIASISISGPSTRITPEKIPAFAEMVIQTSKEISQSMGYSTVS